MVESEEVVLRVGGSPPSPRDSDPDSDMIRESIANSLITAGRLIGQLSGLELAVEVSDHSIKTEMEQPDKNNRAWDTDMYKKGNLFVSGYANPIKPRVQHNEELENPNELDVEEGDGGEETGTENSTDSQPDEKSIQLIASGRYREYMRQDLVSQLLTPESRWNMLVWAVIALGALQFIAIISTFWATGSF